MASFLAQATLNVTVTAVNDTPVAQNDEATVAEDSQAAINVRANDIDVDGDLLSVISAVPGGHGSTSIAGGEVLYTPQPNYNGPDSFSYTISDGEGGTSTATVNITITASNDAPVAQNDEVSVAEDSHVLVNVLVNDSDADGDSLQPSEVGQPSHGSTALLNGQITYKPNSKFSGADSFTYTISDGKGGFATATVAVTVVGRAVFILAVDDSFSTDEDQQVELDLLSNDRRSPDAQLAILTQPSNGALSVSQQGQVTYLPRPDFFGTDSFRYELRDADSNVSSATVAIAVRSINDSPVAQDDEATAEGGEVSVDVLANDSDVDSSLLRISAVSATTNGGTVRITSATSIAYTPPPNFSGVDAFSYNVLDSDNAQSSATVRINVNSRDVTLSWAKPEVVSTTHVSSAPQAILLDNGDVFTTSVERRSNGSLELLARTHENSVVTILTAPLGYYFARTAIAVDRLKQATHLVGALYRYDSEKNDFACRPFHALRSTAGEWQVAEFEEIDGFCFKNEISLSSSGEILHLMQTYSISDHEYKMNLVVRSFDGFRWAPAIPLLTPQIDFDYITGATATWVSDRGAVIAFATYDSSLATAKLFRAHQHGLAWETQETVLESPATMITDIGLFARESGLSIAWLTYDQYYSPSIIYRDEVTITSTAEVLASGDVYDLVTSDSGLNSSISFATYAGKRHVLGKADLMPWKPLAVIDPAEVGGRWSSQMILASSESKLLGTWAVVGFVDGKRTSNVYALTYDFDSRAESATDKIGTGSPSSAQILPNGEAVIGGRFLASGSEQVGVGFARRKLLP